jgi:hypothetical protein
VPVAVQQPQVSAGELVDSQAGLLLSASNPWKETDMVKLPLRTKSIGFKVSEEEYAQLETAAQAGGCTLGEWCREVVLGSSKEIKPIGPGGAETQALMAELVALRAILLNVLFKLANGEKPTAEEMQRLIDRADSDKLRKARERLAQAGESEVHPEEKS